MKKQIQFIGLSILCFLILFPGCSKRPDPRNTIKKFITAVDQSDTTYLKEHLDFKELLKESLVGFSEKEKEELLPQLSHQFLNSFTGEGLIHTRWKNSLLVVGKSEIIGDSATVEISYLNKLSGTKTYTKMGLHLKEGKWKIYNLKLEESRI